MYPAWLYPSVHAKNKRVHAGQLSSPLALFGLANGRVIVDQAGAGAVFGAGGQSDRCAVDPLPDSNRYSAMGDAVTVHVAEWIGRRLNQYGTS